jgi:hypothetical protein
MLAGALVGGALVVRVNLVYALVFALVVVSVVAAATWQLGTSDATWVHAKS